MEEQVVQQDIQVLQEIQGLRTDINNMHIDNLMLVSLIVGLLVAQIFASFLKKV